MKGPQFGPAGNSISFAEKGYKSFADVPRYVVEMGLDTFEYQCGRGVNIGQESATKLGELAGEAGVSLSIHAPYYISLSSSDEQKRKNSARYLLQSAAAARAMGARRIIFHPGSASAGREAALALAKETLTYCLARLDEAGYSDLTFCPETMGKQGQLGNLDEVMELCGLDERLIPCIDFGHLNARTQGGIKSIEDYAAVLDTLANRLGSERGRAFHAHFSKIEYTAGGEKRHLTFEDRVFGPDPRPLMELVARRKLTPIFICESDGTQAEDAAEMKRMYSEAVEQQ